MPNYLIIPKDADIYADKKAGESVFCVTVKELTACGVSRNSILSGIKRQRTGAAFCWQHHKVGRVVYLHFDSLSETNKNIVKAVLLNNLPPLEWYNLTQKKSILEARLTKHLPLTSPDENEILNLILPTGEALPETERAKLTLSSIWVNFLLEHSNKADVTIMGYESIKDFYADVIEYFKSKNIKLPYSYVKLKAKLKEYKEHGLSVLIDKRICTNDNASKVKTEEQQALLIKLMSHYNNLDASQIVQPYNEVAKLKGWAQISRRTVLEYMKKNKLILEAARKGKKAFRDVVSMQVKRTRPSMPLAFWSLDGWKAELYYQKNAVNKAGYNVQTYNNRLVIYIVLDAFNDYPIGYAIGEAENNDLAKAALKNAADHVRELFGEYYRPHQIQSDRAGLKTLRPLFEGMANHFTPAAVENAKAKPVERYNRTLLENYCQYLNNFSGYGVKSKKQPNIDIQNQIKKNFPTREGCEMQLIDIINRERQAKRAQFLGAWEKLNEDRKLPLNREQYLYLFGEMNARTIRFNGRGIMPTIAGELKHYDSFDISMRSDLLTAWTIYHDKKDLTNVLAVSPDEKRRYLLTEKYAQPMALVDRKEGDAEKLQAVRNFNKELEEHVSEKLGAAHETAQRVIETIKPKELTDRSEVILLTDSRGQHKQNLYFPTQDAEEAQIIQSKTERKQRIRKQAITPSTDTALEHAKKNLNMSIYLNAEY